MELPVKSATYAMKGKQLLQRKGIRATVGKRSGEGGCHYYIKVSDQDSEKAWRILQNAGIMR